MEQRVALITGASSGIGAALARQAAARGIAVALTARRTDRVAALADEINRTGGRAIAVAGDVNDLDDQRRMVAETVAAWGRLDILVNNAGLPLAEDFRDIEPGELQRQWNTNVTALATLTRIALPHLEAHGGTVINVGSSISRFAIPNWGNYAPTKIAVAALSKALRRELRARGVRVCLVEPGPVVTEFAARAGMRQESTGPFTISADECAHAILRLFDHPRNRIVVPGYLALPLLIGGAVEDLFPWLLDLAFWLRYRQQEKKAAERNRG